MSDVFSSQAVGKSLSSQTFACLTFGELVTRKILLSVHTLLVTRSPESLRDLNEGKDRGGKM